MEKQNSEKLKALEAALGQIEKQFGKGSVMKLGEFQAMNVEAIPTGALSLDIALGIGGIPITRTPSTSSPGLMYTKSSALNLIIIAQSLKPAFEACIS